MIIYKQNSQHAWQLIDCRPHNTQREREPKKILKNWKILSAQPGGEQVSFLKRQLAMKFNRNVSSFSLVVVPLNPGAPSLTPFIWIWYVMIVFSFRTNFFLYLSSRCSSSKCAFSCLSTASWSTFFPATILFWMMFNYLILRSCQVNGLRLKCGCTESCISCAGEVCLLLDSSIRDTYLLYLSSKIILNIDIHPMMNGV
jgi:hypothetical protein